MLIKILGKKKAFGHQNTSFSNDTVCIIFFFFTVVILLEMFVGGYRRISQTSTSASLAQAGGSE